MDSEEKADIVANYQVAIKTLKEQQDMLKSLLAKSNSLLKACTALTELIQALIPHCKLAPESITMLLEAVIEDAGLKEAFRDE